MTQYYDIKTYKQYDRDVKLAVRRGLDMEQLLTVGMIDGRISPVSSAVWRAHRPQSSASASLFPANRNEFAKNVGVSTRNFKTFCKFAAKRFK